MSHTGGRKFTHPAPSVAQILCYKSRSYEEARRGRSRRGRLGFGSRIGELGTKTDVLLAEDVSITEIDELRPLITEGQERGVLTFTQIASALEEIEITKEQVSELHSYLE